MSINSPQNPAPQTQAKRPAFAPSYNAVQINLDTPTLNAPQMQQPGYYYDYPQAEKQPYYQPVQQQPAAQAPVKNEEKPQAQAPAPQAQAPQPAPQPQVPQPQVAQPAVEDVKVNDVKTEAPAVDIAQVVANLADPDMDKQSLQMEEIARKGLQNEADAVPYVQQDVFEKLLDIVNVDSTKLAGPSDKQIDLRVKIMENTAAAEQAQAQGKDPATVALPYQLTNEEVELANTLTPMEQAERNKEYALYTMAVLQKTYSDEIQKQTGDVVPLTDLPGAAQVVNELKENPNPAIRAAAIDSLRTLKRPEYKADLTKIFDIAQGDSEARVAAAAKDALAEVNA